MHLALQIVLVLAVLALVGFLVPLLVQLRRTARAAEELARSARRDLDRMTQDVHHMRLRVEELSGTVQEALELPSAISRTLSGLLQAVPALFGRKEGGTGSLELLVAGIQAATSLIRRPRAAEEKEAGNA